MKHGIFAGLSMMPEDNFRASVYPLFEEGLVDWVEWTIDLGWGENGVPAWLHELLKFYGEEGRLSGHGVNYSALSAEWTIDQVDWLECLKSEVEDRKYAYMSEHFGYARAGEYVFHAPLPIPYCRQALDIGRRNLAKIRDVARCPVGIENLALAFGIDDVKSQGAFLNALIAPIDGFIILDLHNLYCQSVNFDIPILDLMQSYPLDRVLEMHISGGSLSDSKQGYTEKPIRRDTHDGPVPQELFDILPDALKLCPNAQAVILERLGNTFATKSAGREFANEFRTLKTTVDRLNNDSAFKQARATEDGAQGTDLVSQIEPISTDAAFEKLQGYMLDLLSEDKDARWIKSELQRNQEFVGFRDYLSSMEPRMLEVGQELIRKWGIRKAT